MQKTLFEPDNNLPMERPECPLEGHGKMELRAKDNQTYEQKWCGTWYDCKHPHCSASILLPSKELLKSQNESFDEMLLL